MATFPANRSFSSRPSLILSPPRKSRGFIAKAVQRYDYVLVLYGKDSYADFMKRTDVGVLTLPQSTSNALTLNGDTRSMTILLVLAGVGAATLTGATVYAKKRKNRA